MAASRLLDAVTAVSRGVSLDFHSSVICETHQDRRDAEAEMMADHCIICKSNHAQNLLAGLVKRRTDRFRQQSRRAVEALAAYLRDTQCRGAPLADEPWAVEFLSIVESALDELDSQPGGVSASGTRRAPLVPRLNQLDAPRTHTPPATARSQPNGNHNAFSDPSSGSTHDSTQPPPLRRGGPAGTHTCDAENAPPAPLASSRSTFPSIAAAHNYSSSAPNTYPVPTGGITSNARCRSPQPGGAPAIPIRSQAPTATSNFTYNSYSSASYSQHLNLACSPSFERARQAAHIVASGGLGIVSSVLRTIDGARMMSAWAIAGGVRILLCGALLTFLIIPALRSVLLLFGGAAPVNQNSGPLPSPLNPVPCSTTLPAVAQSPTSSPFQATRPDIVQVWNFTWYVVLVIGVLLSTVAAVVDVWEKLPRSLTRWCRGGDWEGLMISTLD